MSDAVSAQAVIDEVDALFAERGDDLYGEEVTQRQHAVQTAAAARAAGADETQIVACLLHDVGHLLHPDAGGALDAGEDDLHESLGAAWLLERFGPAVAEPARLHVESKRYLCAAEPGYDQTLSEGSRRSLALQGGPMDEAECAAFRAGLWFDRAVALRRCDDLGKDPADHRETIASYHDVLRRVLSQRPPTRSGAAGAAAVS